MGSWNGVYFFPEDEKAAATYDALAENLGGPESIAPQKAIMLADVVRYEEMKELLRADIKARGLGAMAKNGRQQYYKENKSVAMLAKIIDQERRQLQALGLAQKTKDPPDEDLNDDGFDEF